MKKKPARMLVLGLTGGIGMGKSTAAAILRAHGFPVYDADGAVHALLKKGGRAVAQVARLFPETATRGGIDRKKLGAAVFGRPRKLRQLEKILHPLIRRDERAFLAGARRKKARAAILEIPLLFETGGEKRCDYVFCATAPRALQKARVMARPHMSEAKFRAILARQMPDARKREKADFTIPTGRNLAHTAAHIDRALRTIGLLP